MDNEEELERCRLLQKIEREQERYEESQRLLKAQLERLKEVKRKRENMTKIKKKLLFYHNCVTEKNELNSELNRLMENYKKIVTIFKEPPEKQTREDSTQHLIKEIQKLEFQASLERRAEEQLKEKTQTELLSNFIEKRQLVMADTHPVVSLFIKGERENLINFDKKQGVVFFKGWKYPLHRLKAQTSNTREDLLYALNPTNYLAMCCSSFLMIPLEYKQMQAGEAVLLNPGLLNPLCVVPMYAGLGQLKADVDFSSTLAILVNWSHQEILATVTYFIEKMKEMRRVNNQASSVGKFTQSTKSQIYSQLSRISVSLTNLDKSKRDFLYEGVQLSQVAKKVEELKFKEGELLDFEFQIKLNGSIRETYSQLLFLPDLQQPLTQNVFETLSSNKESLIGLQKLHSPHLMIQIYVKAESETQVISSKFFMNSLKGISENIHWTRKKVNVVPRTAQPEKSIRRDQSPIV